MNKLNKVATLIAVAALAAPIVAFAQAKSVDNWRNADGSLVWKNGSNELCWRDAMWTPATAAANCDGAVKARALFRSWLLPQPQRNQPRWATRVRRARPGRLVQDNRGSVIIIIILQVGWMPRRKTRRSQRLFLGLLQIPHVPPVQAFVRAVPTTTTNETREQQMN